MESAFTVCIHNLRKTYAEREVLAIDALTLESNTSYALVGANGSGKTTLLRALAGTSAVQQGTIEVTGAKEKSQVRVGYMPQKPYVFGYSVFKNVALAVAAGNRSADDVRTRVQAALVAVGMDALADASGATLSGGEAQRVALARVLAQDLDVVLLDEPSASMDIEGTLQAEEALAAYRARTGCLLLVATHAPAQARRIAERAVMLEGGHVVEQGDIEDVLLRPSTSQGQAFLRYWQV